MELRSNFTLTFLEESIRKIIREELSERSDDHLMSRKDCMIFLQCSSTSLYYHMKSGNLKYFRLGRTLLFKKSDIIDYITVNKKGENRGK